MTAPTFVVVVHGKPAMQGSKRHVGRGIMVEASKRTRPWRDTVTSAARTVIESGPWERLTGPVALGCTFAFDRPRSHYRTGRNAEQLRDGAPLFPDTRGAGDLDKMVRLVADSLTDAGVWRDDSQVVRVVARKVWAGEDHTSGLDVPGARVTVSAA